MLVGNWGYYTGRNEKNTNTNSILCKPLRPHPDVNEIWLEMTDGMEAVKQGYLPRQSFRLFSAIIACETRSSWR